MSRYQPIFIGVTCCVSLTLGLATSASACESNPQRQPIHVSVDANGTPVATPDSVNACVGDEIRWVFNGPTSREFAVAFTSAKGSPFDWGQQTGSTVTGTVRQGAVKDNKPTDYKYSVDVDGKVLDPKIVVDP